MKYKVITIPLLIIAVGIGITYYKTKENMEKKVLPVIQPRDVNPEMVPVEISKKGLGHRIGQFEFLNQNRELITLDDVKGKVFVAEYFFTTCLTICPIMNEEMKRIQERFKRSEERRVGKECNSRRETQ